MQQLRTSVLSLSGLDIGKSLTLTYKHNRKNAVPHKTTGVLIFVAHYEDDVIVRIRKSSNSNNFYESVPYTAEVEFHE